MRKIPISVVKVQAEDHQVNWGAFLMGLFRTCNASRQHLRRGNSVTFILNAFILRKRCRYMQYS